MPLQSLLTNKCLPISFSSSYRSLPLIAALGLPAHKINWFFVTNFNGMTKRLITKDSAKHENEHLWSSPKPAGNIMKTNLFVILGLLISLSAFSQNLINDAQDSIGLKLVFGGRYTMVVKPGLMRDVAVDDFWELENHARKKIIGVWGTNDNENARFAFFEDSVYYPDTNLWYEYDLIGDTLLITKENNYKVKVLINKISSDSMTLNYLDYGVIKTFKKR